jgi:alginate O-acetyltransferase complex protein AlgI
MASGRAMIFNTWAYGLFLLIAFVFYWGVPVRARRLVLIGLGLFFYAYYYPPHLPLVLATIPVVWVIGRLIAPGQRGARRRWLVVGIAGCLGGLAYYKYQGLGVDAVRTVFRAIDVPFDVRPATVRPPLGISFFVFEYIHYLIEVFRGTFAPVTFRNLALFVMFFPTLICGPIKRYQQFHPEEAGRRFDAAAVGEGLRRILFGLAKKTLIADTVAPLCAPIFAAPHRYDALYLWLGVYGYAIQIYFDFSGYSDIAIGSARLFGYRVPENFDYPYLQPNIARFWRAWHMSLTSWITDYVYIPLGGNRRGEARAAWNRLVSMTLCGLWHGAALHFAVWGLYHGLALSAYRLWQRIRERLGIAPSAEGTVVGRVFGTLVTFHIVCLGWVLFVCDLKRAAFIVPRLLGIR